MIAFSGLLVAIAAGATALLAVPGVKPFHAAWFVLGGISIFLIVWRLRSEARSGKGIGDKSPMLSFFEFFGMFLIAGLFACSIAACGLYPLYKKMKLIELSRNQAFPSPTPTSFPLPSVTPIVAAPAPHLPAPDPLPPGLYAGGARTIQTVDGIRQWNIIKFVDESGVDKRVDGLTEANFKVFEIYKNVRREAVLIEARPIKDDDVVRAVLLLDRSNSMEQPSPEPGFTKMQMIQQAAGFFGKQLNKENHYIGLLTFPGTSSLADWIGLSSNEFWSNGDNEQMINVAVSQIVANGSGTPLWAAINEALEKCIALKEGSYQAIICFTDGDDNSSGNITRSKVIAKAVAAQIPIFMLGYGLAGKYFKPDYLVEVAEKSGAGKPNIGSFINVPPKDWASRFQKIGGDITQAYMLEWEPTGAKPGETVIVETEISYTDQGKEFNVVQKHHYKATRQQ